MRELIAVKRLHERAIIPTRSHYDDAGLDLYAVDGFYLHNGEVQLVPCGIALEIPYGYFGSIRGRSGLSIKGVDVLGGVVDAGYRGEIKVTLVNHGETLRFKAADRVAQLIIQPVSLLEPFEVPELSEAERGENGYGSTGS